MQSGNGQVVISWTLAILTVTMIVKAEDAQPANINSNGNGNIPLAILSDASFNVPNNVELGVKRKSLVRKDPSNRTPTRRCPAERAAICYDHSIRNSFGFR